MAVNTEILQLPPGPNLPRLINGAWLFARPADFFRAIERRHGPVAHVKLPGFGDVVLITDPELIKQVYLNPDEAYAGEASKVMGPVLGPHSVLLLDGAEHMRQRKLMLPPFHGESLRGYEQSIREIATREIAAWPRGKTFAVRPRSQSITLQVILKVIFGVEDPARRDRYSRAVDRLMSVSNLLALNTRADGEISRWSPARMIESRRRAVDDLIFEDLADRRGNPLPGATDVLSLLLAARDDEGDPMTDAELRDELVTLVFAGHETTATAIAWAADLLAWNPEVQERATRAATGDDTEYLDALVNETLRIRPVVWSTGRIVQRSLQLGNWRIPAGFRLWSPMTNLAANRSVYPEPERFDPGRFIGATPPAYAWIPFGGGIRRCIGAAFAQLEMRVVLQEMLRAGQLHPAGKRPERQQMRAVTLAPQHGARVRMTS